MILTQDQISILKEGAIDGNKFILQSQLDRKQYQDINQVLESIGLKWNKGKKAHILDGEEIDLEEAINDIVECGECTTIKETIQKFQFYPTPYNITEQLIDLANMNEPTLYSILEPSAGLGDIAGYFPSISSTVLIELDKEKYNKLKSDSRFCNDEILNMDFLDYNENTFDRIIMNPPFSKSQDVKHILHAYDLLDDGGILVAVASSSIISREGRLYDKLRDLIPEIIKLDSGSFKESGTMVNTIILKLTK